MGAWSSAADVPDQTGRVALVTGANSGLGLEVARALAGKGARVLMACRNLAKAELAADDVRSGGPSGTVEVVPLDLASLASVAELAERVVGGDDSLDLLVNNAGLMAVDESRTADGFEMQFGVNHLGHFALTARLAPLLLATAGSRVVTVSSFGHHGPGLDLDDLNADRKAYSRWPAYFQSKLANILFTLELQRRLDAAGRTSPAALAAHPGGARTDLGSEGHGSTNRLLAPFMRFTTQSAAAGAVPILRAATDPDARGGEYYGPRLMVWGPAVKETPSRAARSPENGRRLWEASQEMTGLPFTIPPA